MIHSTVLVIKEKGGFVIGDFIDFYSTNFFVFLGFSAIEKLKLNMTKENHYGRCRDKITGFFIRNEKSSM